MKARLTHVAVYRYLTALYPAAFRHQYRSDLVALFAAQLRHEPPTRVWLRTLRDLSVTVPAQQLEARMNRPAGNVSTVVFSVAAASAGLLALTMGSARTALLFVAFGIATGGLAAWSWEGNRSVRVPGLASKSWWKFVLAGLVLAGVTFAAIKMPWPDAIDLGDMSYWLVVIAGVTSVTLVGLGILLAVGNLFRRHRPPRLGAPVA